MKNIWHKTVVAAAVAAVFAAPACKSVAGDSVYEIVPLREKAQPAEGEPGDYDVPRELTAHIFMDVEGTNWKPLSYDDAVEGVLSDTVSEVRGTLRADATFGQEEDGSLRIGSLQGDRRHYLVVCDVEDTIYAWREMKTAGDAGTIRLSVYFRPWRAAASATATYTDTGWTVRNRYVAPVAEGTE